MQIKYNLYVAKYPKSLASLTNMGGVNTMKKFYELASKITIILFVLIILLCNTDTFLTEATAYSSQPLTFDELTIQLFPEFTVYPNLKVDQPSILISYQGKVSNKSDHVYNGDITLPIESNSSNFMFGLVTEIKDDQQKQNLDYLIDNDKELLYISPSRPINIGDELEFVIQYYITPFNETDRRDYIYNFIAYNDITKLDVFVYPPLGSRYFELEPIGINIVSNKLESYYYSYNNINKGDVKRVSFSYIKGDNIPTFDILMKHSNNNNELIEKNNGVNNLFMLVLILLSGLLLIIIIKKSSFQFRLREQAFSLKNKDNEDLKLLRGLYVNDKISELEYYKRRTLLHKKERQQLE